MIQKEQILQAYETRHATKEFAADKTIAQEDFAFIMETARLSPSSFGFEPWNFLVVQNRALRDKLSVVSWGRKSNWLQRVILSSSWRVPSKRWRLIPTT